MKRFITTTILLFLVIGGLSTYLSSTNRFIDCETLDNPFAGEMKNRIDALKEREWDRSVYNSLINDLEAYNDGGLLDNSTFNQLKHQAKVNYIHTLNSATEAFFSGVCNNEHLLARINAELIRLDRDRQVSHLVAQNRDATSRVFQLIGYANNQGWTPRVNRFFTGDFNLNTAQSLTENIKQFLDHNIIGDCQIVINSVNDNLNKLNEFHISYLKEKIKNYNNLFTIDHELRANIIQAIDDYEMMNYFLDSNEASIQANALRDMVN